MMNYTGAGAVSGSRLRTMRILWAVFLINIGLFVLVSRLIRADSEAAAGDGRGDPALFYALAAGGLASVIASFVVKSIFYRRAAELQQPAQVQTGLIVALALCEAAALMGLVGLLVTWNEYAYLLFALGALGMALHFPRRGQVEAAYYKPAG